MKNRRPTVEPKEGYNPANVARPPYAVGTPVEQTAGVWLLNPLAPFAITITGGTEEVITSLKRGLDRSMDGTRGGVDRAFTLYVKHGLRCREVESWIADMRPSLEHDIGQRKAASAEYQELMQRPEATENRRRKMEAGFRAEAYHGLSIRPVKDYSGVFSDDTTERQRASFDLLAHGYATAAHAAERVRRHGEYQRDVSVRNWLIHGHQDACNYCKQFFGKHPPNYYPRIPIHIACTCQISPNVAEGS